MGGKGRRGKGREGGRGEGRSTHCYHEQQLREFWSYQNDWSYQISIALQYSTVDPLLSKLRLSESLII